MKFAIDTLGCKVNQYESDAIIKLFEDRGYELTDSVADIYIINTCVVTNLSARKSRQLISKAKKENPKGLIAVIGCYPQTEPGQIEDLGVDVILGSQKRRQIVDMCERALDSKEKINLVDDFSKDKEFEELTIEDNHDMTRAYLKIQEGCNQFCTYCIIPYARGPIRSRDMDNILEETKRLVDNGYKELVITGIHVASYGYDLSGSHRLIDVLENISKIRGLERIRLSSLEPRIVDVDFMDRLTKIDQICDHFHLSLQSGSDKILKKMNRKYTRKEYIAKADLIKSYYPNAGLTSDIIVGFPGETEEDFQDSIDIVRQVNFSSLHVFRYSQRRGTPAAGYKNQINGNIKKERSERLRSLAESVESKFLKDQVGKTHEVLFEKMEGDYNTGHTTNYLKLRLRSAENLEGQIKDVIIIGIEDNSLIGELV